MNRYSAWSSLKNLGVSKISRSSFIWLILIPIVVKLLEIFPHTFKIDVYDPLRNETYIVEYNLGFLIQLPFSWKIFFLASLVFSIANIFYLLFCPGFIKDFDYYSDFKRKGFTMQQLNEYILEHFWNKVKIYSDNTRDIILDDNNVQKITDFLKDAIGQWIETEPYFQKFHDKPTLYNYLIFFNKISRKDLDESEMQNLFWAVQSEFNGSNIYARGLCTITYSIGSVLFSIVVIQNLLSVFRYIL